MNYEYLYRPLWVKVLIIFRFAVLFTIKPFIQIVAWYMVQDRRGITAMTFHGLLKSYELRMKSTKVLILRHLTKFDTKV